MILFNIDPEAVEAAVRQQGADLQKPAMTAEELLNALASSVPDFAAALRDG